MHCPGGSRWLRPDTLLGLALAAAATGTLLLVVPVAVADPPAVQYAALSPAFLPEILLVVVALSGLWLALHTALAAGPVRGDAPAAEPAGASRILPRVVCLAMLGCYAFALPVLGATLTAILVTIVMLLVGGVTQWSRLLAYGVLLPMATVQFFVRVGHVPLPAVTLLGP